MGRTCAWCNSVIDEASASQGSVSHVLCGGCHVGLRRALAAQHLHPRRAGFSGEDPGRAHRRRPSLP